MNKSLFLNEVDSIKQILNLYQPIHLSQMKDVELMNRMDTKFCFPISELENVLKALQPYYSCFEIDTNRISAYTNLYFDSSNFSFYKDHHNRKNHRFKVRYRKYETNNISFLEVKEKRKGRVRKQRINTDNIHLSFPASEQGFVSKIIGSDIQLEAKLWNNYKRITLVNHAKTERLTLDFDINYHWENTYHELNNLVIAELKQQHINRHSYFYKYMRTNEIRPYRISKYCIGAISLFSSKSGNIFLKYNRFKQKIKKLNKLKYDLSN